MMKMGSEMPRATGTKAEVRNSSTMSADKGGETDERMGPRRWAAWRILSNWRNKGLSELADERSKGRSGNSRRWKNGEEETKAAMWSASAAETRGVGQMNVTAQPREASVAARRRKGLRCPMPALKSSAK